jgi:nicotinamide-nucleotide amidase
MRIWIISSGAEILQGLYPDTNAWWLSARLLELGFEVERHLALPDRDEALRDEIARAAHCCDLIVMSGGLGPTEDDLTRAAVARIYDVKLIEDARALGEIEERFKKRGREMAASNRVQALLPAGSTPLYNQWGTAPGFVIEPRGADSELRATLCALPGPPRELRPMFDRLAAPILLERFADRRRSIRTLTMHTVGLAESHVNDRLADLFGADPKVNLALLAGQWRVDVRLTLAAESPEENAALAARWRAWIAERLGADRIFGEGAATLPEVVGSLLRARGQTLAAAESCTGGLVAKQITDVAGSSDYFIEGFVTYSNAAKTRALGVDAKLLESRGAVSPQVAEAMAASARRVTGADWAIGVTGVAGPGGGTAEKPVGLVYLGLASPDGAVRNKRLMSVAGDREGVREFTAVCALDWLRRAILRVESGEGESRLPRAV